MTFVDYTAYSFRMGDFDCPMSPSASSTSSSDSSGLNTRSVEDLRRKYRKEFVKMGTSGGVCQHCGSVTNKIVHYRCGGRPWCDLTGWSAVQSIVCSQVSLHLRGIEIGQFRREGPLCHLCSEQEGSQARAAREDRAQRGGVEEVSLKT